MQEKERDIKQYFNLKEEDHINFSNISENELLYSDIKYNITKFPNFEKGFEFTNQKQKSFLDYFNFFSKIEYEMIISEKNFKFTKIYINKNRK